MNALLKKICLLFCLIPVACQGPSPLPQSVGQSPTLRTARTPAFSVQPQSLLSEVPVPPGNPITQAKVELGFRLFFEPRLSADNRMSCATCHQPRRGFSNGEATAAGVTGQRGHRNTPTIYQTAIYPSLFWDGRSPSLEDQALGPIQNPVEMNENLPHVVRKLSEVPYYRIKFQQTFGTPVTASGMAQALASFERALSLKPSAYDRYLDGQMDALTPQQERGMVLFGRRAHCATCHKGVQFTDKKFHNLGVGMDRPRPDLGRFEVTRNPEDTGAFKTPSLRNITQTGPYMHDGSLRDLEAVIDFYDRGGIVNPYLSREMNPLDLSAEEKSDLLAFLQALTSEDNLREIAALPGVKLPTEQLPEVLLQLR